MRQYSTLSITIVMSLICLFTLNGSFVLSEIQIRYETQVKIYVESQSL